MDYDNNSGLGSAVMSVLGWIPQEDSDEVSNEEDEDTVDEIPSNADIDSVISDEEDEDSIDYGSDTDSECDIDAPVMSPISDVDGNNYNANPVPCFSGYFAGNSAEPEQTYVASSEWHGFKAVGNNIDNIRPSFSRLDKNTNSLHCFHHYAGLDRVNLSSLSDVTPNAPVDVDKLLINCNDVPQLNSDAVVQIARYIHGAVANLIN